MTSASRCRKCGAELARPVASSNNGAGLCSACMGTLLVEVEGIRRATLARLGERSGSVRPAAGRLVRAVGLSVVTLLLLVPLMWTAQTITQPEFVIPRVRHRVAEARARLDAAKGALDAYRARSGRYPEDLQELAAGGWLAQDQLVDPFGEEGRLLGYRLLGTSRGVVYSIGPDLVDEEGSASFGSEDSADGLAGDLVVPFGRARP